VSDVSADQELVIVEQQPKGFNPLAYTPAEALTKAEYDRLMAARTRPLTQDPIQRRRGSGSAAATTTTDMKDFS
jgi:hypothetical protein